MKPISAALQEHLNGELTTLAELVKITRKDGVVIALTNHDEDIAWDGVVFRAEGSFSDSVLEQDAALKGNDYDVKGVLESAAIDEADLRAGLYDNARIDVFFCNWADMAQGVVPLRRGWLGDVVFRGGAFVASLRGLHDLLTRKVGESYTPECRFDLGDARCGVDVAALQVYGSVTQVFSETQFMDAIRTEESGVFAGGRLSWISGANAGASMEVSGWDAATQTFTLWLPMAAPVAMGDAYCVTPGCDKRFATCKARFCNGARFGGFPHVPGVGKILAYPDAR